MNIKLESTSFTLEEILYNISKGKKHLIPLIINKVEILEAQLNLEKQRAENAESELKKYLHNSFSTV